MFSFSNLRALDAPSMNHRPGKVNFRELKSLEACSFSPRLDFRRLPGPVFDSPRRERREEREELFRGMSAGSFSQTAAGNRAYLSPSFRKSVSIYPRSAPAKRLGGEMICYL